MGKVLKYKKIYRCAFVILFAVIAVCSFSKILKTVGNGYRDEVEMFYEVKPLDAAIGYYKGDFIYICSPDTSMLQIFSKDGEFKKGIYLPSNGGMIWMGTNTAGELYIYCVRSKCEVLIKGEQFFENKDNSYNSPEDFYRYNGITNENQCKVNKNCVDLTKNNEEYSIRLNAPLEYFNLQTCIFLLIICINGALVFSVMFKKMLDQAVRDIDKRRDPYEKIRRRK